MRPEMELSVVIITKNEAHIIGNTLQRLKGVSNDVVVIDSGSTDGTQSVCTAHGARLIETGWEGYGANKNKGNTAAAHDWIFSLDADEALDDELKAQLATIDLNDDTAVYRVKRRSFFCNKPIRYGEWGNDSTIRLFNRKKCRWNNEAVHETLDLPPQAQVQWLKGSLLHYTVSNVEEYMEKTVRYAKLSAEKYFAAGRQAGYFKIYVAPLFGFLQHYIFRLGFLDGKEGFIIARTTAKYTYLKYLYLRRLNDKK